MGGAHSCIYLPILTGLSFQICLAYSLIVRSEENLPTRAVFMMAIFAQRFSVSYTHLTLPTTPYV